MGVSLSLPLDGTRTTRARWRPGQHTRSAEEQACLDALAAFLRSDSTGASRCLSRVSRANLAARLLPAARALARAADLALTSDPAAAPDIEPDFVLSRACLLGLCYGLEGNACQSPACQHDCHYSAAV